MRNLSKTFYDVLDYGYVEICDVMGDDQSIANTARTSTKSNGKQINPLIRYLARKQHTTPFEFGVFIFKIKAPIFVARQWIRHRMSSTNETSGRYVEFEMPEFYIPCESRIKGKGIVNKQASEGLLDIEKRREFIELLKENKDETKLLYAKSNKLGVSNELSRLVITVNFYTEWMWKIDLHNLFKFLKLRDDEHAQEEIQYYAKIISDIVSQLFPLSHQAWLDYEKNAVKFSAMEMELIREMYQFCVNNGMFDNNIEWKKYKLSEIDNKNEIDEFYKKIELK